MTSNARRARTTDAWGRPIPADSSTAPRTNAWGRPLTREQQESAAAAAVRAEAERKNLASIVESRVTLGDAPDQAERYAREFAAEQHRTHNDVLAALNIGWRAESLRKQAQEAAKPPIRSAAQVLDEHRRRTRPASPTARRVVGS
ncbi:hypothetical protein [Micropruina sp.]|uniref:hypothetical protein n=1 Tax=Micropruina sp. TaxID=2737536 RepID=UPI0039E570AB